MRSPEPKTALTLAIAIGICGCGARTSSPPSAGPASLAPDPAAKAAMELATARQQEAMKQNAKAIATYERIVREHADSPQAKFASERLASLLRK